MIRTGMALVAVATVAAATNAQPRPLPLSPGVMPASPYGPGMPARPPAPIQPVRPGNPAYFPGARPGVWGGGWGYPPFSPWVDYGYSYGGYPPVTVAPAPVVAEPSRRSDPKVVLAQEFPATLTLQFPAAAEVWLSEKKVVGDAREERVLTSPVLKAGETYTFDVKARWTSGGKTYETKRAVTLTAGDRSRLGVLSGDEVKE